MTKLHFCSGVGAPVVDWLWDGFNALVLSYGQAEAGKTSLLLGRSPPSFLATAEKNQTATPGTTAKHDEDKSLHPSWENSSEETLEHRGGGLLEDILRSLFDKVCATRRRSPIDMASTGSGNEDDAEASSSSQAYASGAISGATTAGGAVQHGLTGGVEPIDQRTHTIAFSAWDVMGKTVRDLLSPTAPTMAAASMKINGAKSGDGAGACSRPQDDARGRDISPSLPFHTPASAEVQTKNDHEVAAAAVEAAAETCNSSKVSKNRNSRRRRRSGSADNYSRAGRPSPEGLPSYPDGFETVRVPDLSTALALLDKARRRSLEGRPVGAVGGGARKGAGGRRGGGGGAGGAAGGRSGEVPAPMGHAFFRVVLYNEEEETASTLHVVDLVGGWKVKRRLEWVGGGWMRLLLCLSKLIFFVFFSGDICSTCAMSQFSAGIYSLSRIGCYGRGFCWWVPNISKIGHAYFHAVIHMSRSLVTPCGQRFRSSPA